MSYEEQAEKTYNFCSIPQGQLKAFRERVIKQFRTVSTEDKTNYNYFVWRCMTQDEREIIASLIKNGKTSKEIGDALEHYWFGDEQAEKKFEEYSEIPF